ncbi:NrtR DNA-binding winged helix domain-containing protein [Acetobacter estunensis]|uniref:NrtR DNA-binding winged helix domain-containing protein n=1 Tax=Acetobacter estunensis TaxID=104097 RepID=UPI001C2D81FB|nr:hypothetical protein [Acetobacter estunensis]MBV1838775.1 hypothetical protein [Acetobacter estunensis]
MKGGTQVIVAAVPIALNAGEPYVRVTEDGELPHVCPKEAETNVREVLESLLVRSRRLPDACAEPLPVCLHCDEAGTRIVELPYLVSTRMTTDEPGWVPCYDLLPWEDHRREEGMGQASALGKLLIEQNEEMPPSERLLEKRRLDVLFALGNCNWKPPLAKERWAAIRDGAQEKGAIGMASGRFPHETNYRWLCAALGHLRLSVIAQAMPVNLMPERFTIPQLHAAVEGILGEAVDRPTFRRGLTNGRSVEDTGACSDEVFGRPARLMRFRTDVVVANQTQGIPLALSLADTVKQAETIDRLFPDGTPRPGDRN